MFAVSRQFREEWGQGIGDPLFALFERKLPRCQNILFSNFRT